MPNDQAGKSQSTISIPNMVPVEIPDPTSTTGKRTVLAPQVPMTTVAPITRWALTSVPDGTSGLDDMAAGQQRALLTEGWEPFAVSGGRVWFRLRQETFK